MTRFRRDIDDIEDVDLLDAAETKQLRADRAADFARMERSEQIRNEAEAKRQEAVARWRIAANAGHVLDTYRAAGVEPPPLEPNQTRCSLSLLLSVGWRITEFPDGTRVLVQPSAGPEIEQRGAYQITTPELEKAK